MSKPALSMQVKLTAWYVLLFALFLLVSVLFAFFLRARRLEHQFDAMLLHRAQDVAGIVVKLEQPWTLEPVPEALSGLNVAHLSLWDEDGNLIFSQDGTNKSKLPLHIVRGQADRSVFWTVPSDRTMQLYELDAPLRVVTLTFHDDARHRYYVQLGAQAGYREIIATGAQAIFTIMIPISVLVAGVLMWFLVGRALQPMAQLSKAAKDVTPDRLSPIDIHPAGTEASTLQESLNQALERIDAGYRARERFISFAAHELKTPISVVLTESQILRTSSPSIADFEQYLSSVEEEMRRLGKLIESFLMLSRAEHGQQFVLKEIVSINDVVLDAVSECAAYASHNEVRLVPNLVFPEDCDFDPDVFGDAALLRALVDNLIRNAVRHSDPGERIDITVECTDRHATISVRDRGPGVKPEIIEHIFDHFTQFSDERGRTGQVGLGLAIARHVAELHDGTIKVENCEDGGCRFTATLPLHGVEPSISECRAGTSYGG